MLTSGTALVISGSTRLAAALAARSLRGLASQPLTMGGSPDPIPGLDPGARGPGPGPGGRRRGGRAWRGALGSAGRSRRPLTSSSGEEGGKIEKP